uniref:Calx-beta domain-containing protein n=1 Tax=Syphacia muris TaxID=451379 RepID=A0A0N5ACZ9_9BILA
MYGFGSVYFGVISKSATRADTLYIYNWSKENVAPFLNGARITLLDDIQSLRGSFILAINGIEREVAIDFDLVTSFSEAGERLQKSIRGAGIGLDAESEKLFSEAKAYYNPVTQGFTIVSGGTGDGNTISFALPYTAQKVEPIEVVQSVPDIDSIDNPLTLKESEFYTLNFTGLPTNTSFKITYNDVAGTTQEEALTLAGNKLTIPNDLIVNLINLQATNVKLIANDPDDDNAQANPKEVEVNIVLEANPITEDIHDKLGLTQDEGATAEAGYNGLETLSEVLADIEGNN